MWKIKLLYLIVYYITIIKSDKRSNEKPNYKCSISSEFVSYLFTGLINEYKYKDIEIINTYVNEMSKKLDIMDEHLRKAIRGDFDSEFRNFGFSTVSIRQKMNYSLEMAYLMNARPTDFNINYIADLITNDDFNTASDLIARMENEILIYPIVEVVFRSERQMLSIENLINFTYHMLTTREISKIVAMEFMMFREMTKDPDNLITYDMVVFAELLRETMQKLKTFYKHDTNQPALLKKLNIIKISLPQLIQNLVFFKQKICFRNARWKEFLFVGDFHYDNQPEKRIVYTWEHGLYRKMKEFILTFDRKKIGYTIKNVDLNEYMYSAENTIVYDVDNRFTFTKPTISETSYWSFTPIDNFHFAIRNIKNNEYIYTVEDETFLGTYDKRRVFSRRVQGDLNVHNLGSQLWEISTKCY